MTGDKASIQEVPKAPEQQMHNLNTPDLQRGGQGPEAQKAGSSDLSKMGFPDTQIAGLEKQDQNFQPSDVMGRKGGTGQGVGQGASRHLDGKGSAAGGNAPDQAQEGQSSKGGSHNAAAHDHPGTASGDAHHGQPAENPGGSNSVEQNSFNSKFHSDGTRSIKPADQQGKDSQPSPDSGNGFDDGSSRDNPNTRTKNFSDGSSASSVWDQGQNSYTQVNKDANGNVTSIDTNDGTHPGVKTTYDANGKPTSETVGGNGTRKWDSNGNLTSDTRSDKSNTNKPDNLIKEKNPDGTTSVTAGPGDGSKTSWTYDKDGQIKSQQQEDGNGNRTTDDFYGNGNLARQDRYHLDTKTNDWQDRQTQFNQQGNYSSEQYNDSKGNYNFVQKDDNGNLVRREQSRPDQKLNQSETWNDSGYHSWTRQNGVVTEQNEPNR